jgi:hypothetical protein
MPTKHQKSNRESTVAATGDAATMPDNARDREMGRTEAPLGDLGQRKTWQPPSGEQGLSNRAGDEDTSASSDDVDAENGAEAGGDPLDQLQTGLRPRRAGEDPVANQDPNAEDASLAADAEGVKKVRALKDETERTAPKDQDVKGTGGRRLNEVIK